MMPCVASRAACVGVLLLICARQTLSAPELQPALLTNSTAQSISELQRAVRDALNGAPVRLAGDALTQNSILVVERVQPRDAAGLPLNGRELGKPEHFRLVKHGAHCILIHERTGKHWALRSATCAAEVASK
jgi:hypothetical protein